MRIITCSGSGWLRFMWLIEERLVNLLANPLTQVTDSWHWTKMFYYIDIDHNGAQNWELGTSLSECERVMVFSERSLWRKRQISKVYDVIQELFRKKRDGRPMDDHYGEFNLLAKELWQTFSITSDVKQMQNQWNQLMVLTYLGTLDPIYS